MRTDAAADLTACRAAEHTTGLAIPHLLSRATNAACTVDSWIKLHVHQFHLAGRHDQVREAGHGVVDSLQRAVRGRSRP